MLIILSIVLIIVGLFLGILIGTLGSFGDSEIPIKEDKIIKRCLLFNIASRCDKIILVCCTPFGLLGILLLFVCCFVFQHIIGIILLNELTKKNMKKGTKFYAILGYNTETETWYGYVENSFSMGVDKNRIRTFSTCKGDYPWKDRSFSERKRIAKAYLKKHGYRCNFARDYIIDAKMNPNSPNQWIYFYLRDIVDNLNKKHYNNCYWKVYRVNSVSCPIDVNMYEYYKALGSKNFRKTLSKYQLRNQEFSVKKVSKD